MFCHPHVSNWSLEIVFSSNPTQKIQSLNPGPIRDPTYRGCGNRKCSRASVEINCQLSMYNAQLFRHFPRFSFPHFHFHFPLPTPGTIASRVTIKGEENRLCGRWRAAAIFMYFLTSVKQWENTWKSQQISWYYRIIFFLYLDFNKRLKFRS